MLSVSADVSGIGQGTTLSTGKHNHVIALMQPLNRPEGFQRCNAVTLRSTFYMHRLSLLQVTIIILFFSATPQPIYVSPEVSDITQNSAVISWIHPGGTVNVFTLQYTTTADGASFTVTVDDGDSTAFLLSGLNPGTAYSVRIASTNDNGTSAFSPAASFTTTGIQLYTN